MKFNFILFLTALFLATGCYDDSYHPKPNAYPRVELPLHEYQKLEEGHPYSFMQSTFSTIQLNMEEGASKDWINVFYPSLNATIYITYKPIDKNQTLETLVNDSHKLTFRHTTKASGISESMISDKNRKLYGIFYDVRGNSASPIQFYLTDSSKHFMRGSVYFYAQPNADSIAPMSKWISADVIKLIDSFQWK